MITTNVMTKRKRSDHYVNNKDFLAALIKYREDVEIASLQDKPKPVIPRYIGECFLKIANHLSFKPNFVNYMFKDDMICDGIENCVQYIHNFNPKKSENPFAYFTQIIFYAFLRRIAKEKKQSYIKNRLIKEMPFEAFELQEQDEDGTFHNAYLDYMQFNQSDLDDYMDKKTAAKKKKNASSLDEFIGDPDEPISPTTTP